MADTATAKYLSDNVGGVLSKAMAELTVRQPSDGVEFLSQWLKTYAEQEEAKVWREREDKALEEERAKTQQKLKEDEAARQKKHDEQKRLDDAYQDLLNNFNNEEVHFEDTFWDKMLAVAQVTTGAKAAYLGALDEQGIDGVEGPIITYDYAVPGSEWMKESFLPKGEGVTWGVFEENPPEEAQQQFCLWKPPEEPKPPPTAEDEEPPPEEEATPSLKYWTVNVPCVTDVSSVRYFDMTRLGAYMAVPLVYQSYHNGNALADATEYEKNRLEILRRRQKAEEEAEAAAADPAAAEAGGEAVETPDGGAPEEEEEKPMVLRGEDVKLVLCLDTLGLNTRFTEEHLMKMFDLCKACSDSKSRTESKQIYQQAQRDIDEERRESLLQEIADARTEADQAEQDLQAQEEETAEANEKECIQLKFAYRKALKVASDMRAHIIGLGSWVYAQPEVMNIILATALLYKYPKESLYPRRKSTLQWPKLKRILEDALFEKMEQTPVDGPRKDLPPEHKLSYIAGLVTEDMNEEKAKDISPAFEVLLALLQSAIAYRKGDIELRKAQYNSAKAEAEEAGETFSEPPLTELDDDIEE